MLTKDVLFKALLSLSLGVMLISPPLKAGTMGPVIAYKPWRAVIEVGIMPTVYKDDAPARGFFPTVGAAQNNAKQFSDQSSVPWAVGLEFDYAFNPDNEVFFELSYARGAGKTYIKNFQGGLTVNSDFDDFTQFAGFIGMRHFFPVQARLVHPYLGAKLGATHRDTIHALEQYSGTMPLGLPRPTNRQVTYYEASSSLAGGLQIGLDYRSTLQWGTGIKAEVLAQSERVGQVIAYNAPLSRLRIGNTGMILQFPVMIYLKTWW